MRALLLSPHNDDETLFASFLCLRYEPHVVVCFRSQLQKDVAGITAYERETETDAAMMIYGCDWRQWPLLDTAADPEEVEAWMWGLRDPAGNDDDWDIVFAPAHERGGNAQHNLIAELADRVFTGVELQHYLTYTGGAVRSRSEKEIEFEPAWLFKKHAALACYQSQVGTPSWRHFVEDLREYLA